VVLLHGCWAFHGAWGAVGKELGQGQAWGCACKAVGALVVVLRVVLQLQLLQLDVLLLGWLERVGGWVGRLTHSRQRGARVRTLQGMLGLGWDKGSAWLWLQEAIVLVHYALLLEVRMTRPGLVTACGYGYSAGGQSALCCMCMAHAVP
jgi:hypothetical protein